MKRIATILTAAVALAGISLSAAFAAPNDKLPEDIKAAGVLILGTTASIGMPWTSIKEGTTDEYVGVEPELAAEIAKRLGLKLEVRNLGFDSLIPSLEANRINIIMSNMLDTPVRQKKVDFVDHILGGSAMLQSAKSDKQVAALDDLCGLSASALRGAMEGISATKQSEKCVAEGKPAVDIQLYPDTGAQLTALGSNRTDVALTDLVLSGMLAQQSPDRFKMVGEPFNFGPCGIAVAKDSPLAGLIAEALDAMVADGTYGAIMEKNGFVKQSYITKAAINGGADSQ